MKLISTNKKAFHNYYIEDKFEAGIELLGSEVKSLRAGHIGFADSFAKIKNGEVWLYSLNIPVYENASFFNHEPTRKRRLLLHHHEIRRLTKKTEQQGYTLVPLSVYFNDDGKVKVEIGLVQGKRTPDKKQVLMDRVMIREAERAKKSVIKGGGRYED
jgi:SsrA-binding protein